MRRLANTCVSRTASPATAMGSVGQVDDQLVSSRLEHRPAGVDGRAHDGREIQRFALDIDQPPRDARDFQQIVHEANEVADLALHDGRHPRGNGVLEAAQFEELQTRQQRRQRIAQLVSERREELVLALIGETQRFLGARPVLEVPADLVLALARTKGRADRAEERGHTERALEQRHVAEGPDSFVELGGISAAARQDEHRKIGPRRLGSRGARAGTCWAPTPPLLPGGGWRRRPIAVPRPARRTSGRSRPGCHWTTGATASTDASLLVGTRASTRPSRASASLSITACFSSPARRSTPS